MSTTSLPLFLRATCFLFAEGIRSATKDGEARGMPEKRNPKKPYRYSGLIFKRKCIIYSRIIGLEKMRIEISRFF